MYLLVAVLFVFLRGYVSKYIQEILDDVDQNKAYREKFREEKRDLWKFVPIATENTFPASQYPGLYGYTYLGSKKIWKADDLEMKGILDKVRLHELKHTPDEYETRRQVEWILEWMNPVADKYLRRKEYLV